MPAALVVEAVSSAIPAHVAPELVKRFDFITGLGDRPQETVAALLDGPPIFYSPVRHAHLPGGAWVVASAELVKEVLADTETFSSVEQGRFMDVFGEGFIFPPLAVDPPRHTDFRALINPIFTPARMIALSPKIEAWCNELIDRFEAKGRCNFIAEFADLFPTGIFIDLMGFPRERVPEFVSWVQDFIHGDTDQVRFGGLQRSIDFFDEVFHNPTDYADDTMVRYLLDSQPEGRPMTRGEFIGVAFMVFTAGLDTVVSTLGFVFRLLCEQPEMQAHLRANPKEIPRHVEEMMRFFSPVTPQRVAARDTVLGGVTVKAGDVLALALTAASRDPSIFANPDKFDASRNPNPHFAFSGGIHRCAGSHLARRDLAIALEVWLRRLPSFRLAAEANITAAGGAVLTLDGLILEWG